MANLKIKNNGSFSEISQGTNTAIVVNETGEVEIPGLDLKSDLAGTGVGEGAALVGFKQEGTGAVVRTLEDKAREWVSVKDFGAVGDGVTDDTAAIQSFFDNVVDNGRFGLIPSGNYKVTSRINIVLKGKGFYVLGSGVEGTRFIASDTFSGSTQVIRMIGSGNQPGFFLGGFSIRTSTNGSGSAVIGLQVGNETVETALIAGFNTSTIKNVFIADFETCFKVTHTRLIRFEDCSAWNNNFPSENTCLSITQNGLFTGDIIFDRCQFVNSKAPGRYCVNIESIIGPYNITNGHGAIAGIKFRSCDFYSGDRAINVYATNSSWVTDIWFVDGCQIDQEVTNCIRFESKDLGTLVSNIHLDGVYTNKATGNAVIFSSSGTGGTISDIWVSDCEMWQPQSAAINFFGVGIKNVNVLNNSIIDCPTTAGAISFNGTKGIVCHGNRVRKDIFNKSPYYLIDLLPGCDDISVIANHGSGVVNVLTVRDESGDVQKIIDNNPGYNPRSQQAITVGPSPFTYKNTSGAPQYVYISGGSVSNLTIAGAFGVDPLTNSCWVIPQGRSITVEYSSAPTMFSIGV